MGYPYIAIGSTPLIDLRSDTVAENNLAYGYTAHDQHGNPITGSLINAWDVLATGNYGWAWGDASFIQRSAFKNLPITSANFPNAVSISSGAFSGCTQLREASFPACVDINDYAFNTCYQLSKLTFPLAENVGLYAFEYCYSLTTVELDACQRVRLRAFNGCSNLDTVVLPNVSLIYSYAFSGCSKLTSVYLMRSAITQLSGTQQFPVGSSGLKIYVPASLYSQYMAAVYWSAYTSNLVSA